MKRYCLAILIPLVWSCASAALDGGAGPAGSDGERLYRAQCARCHRLYQPAEFRSAHWRRYVEKYGKRAGLDKEEKEAILRYLLTNQ